METPKDLISVVLLEPIEVAESDTSRDSKMADCWGIAAVEKLAFPMDGLMVALWVRLLAGDLAAEKADLTVVAKEHRLVEA